MVYVPNSSSNEVMSEEPEVEVHFPGSEVHSSDRLPFVFDLIGADMETSLEKAKEMGLTGDDLGFIEQQDIDSLLQTSLLRRKLTAVCAYLKEGGTLKHGMTMSDVYNGPEPKSIDNDSKPTDTADAADASDQQVEDNDAEQRKNWIKSATAAFNKIPGQLRNATRYKRQLQGMLRQIKALLNI